jgi:hypothetical protein
MKPEIIKRNEMIREAYRLLRKKGLKHGEAIDKLLITFEVCCLGWETMQSIVRGSSIYKKAKSESLSGNLP